MLFRSQQNTARYKAHRRVRVHCPTASSAQSSTAYKCCIARKPRAQCGCPLHHVSAASLHVCTLQFRLEAQLPGRSQDNKSRTRIVLLLCVCIYRIFFAQPFFRTFLAPLVWCNQPSSQRCVRCVVRTTPICMYCSTRRHGIRYFPAGCTRGHWESFAGHECIGSVT